jgi:hypothetical protein
MHTFATIGLGTFPACTPAACVATGGHAAARTNGRREKGIATPAARDGLSISR